MTTGASPVLPEAPLTIDKALFRQIAGSFASGVTVITTGRDGAFHGMTASSFASLSLDPMYVLVCVDRNAETLDFACAETRTPLTNALEGERAREVRKGLKRLGRLDRDTLVAFYVRGQSLVEMSDAFEAPVGTIKRRLHVARKRLAKHVEAVAAV